MNRFWKTIRLGFCGFASGLACLGFAGTVLAQPVGQGEDLASGQSSPAAPADRLELSVEDCRRMAMENSMAVKNARLDILAAKAQKQEALASYFPDISANAFAFAALQPMFELGVTDILGTSDLAVRIQDILGDLAAEFGLNSSYSMLHRGFMASVSAMQPVFAGGRIVNGNRLAAVGVEAATLQEQIALRDMDKEVESGYWQVVSLEEKRITLQELATLLDTLYKDVASARQAGLATETDVMQVELKRDEVRSGFVQVESGVKLAKMNLFNTIGLAYNPYQSVVLDSLPVLDSIFLVDRLPEEEIASRQQEMRLLDLSVDASRLQKKMALGEALPQIGIGGSYGYGNLLSNGEFNGAVYVMAQIPLSDWGKTARKMQRLGYQMEKAENERDFLQQQILLQIRKLWLDLTVAWDQLQIARKSEATARASVEKLNAYYRAGMSPLSELLQAQTELRSVADKCVDQEIAYRNALHDYLARCGAGMGE